MNTITWLHLSDFHFQDRGQQQWDEDGILKTLHRDIADQIEQGKLQPDFIVVTGDIAFSGKVSEYKLASQFFDSILSKAGLGKDRLFMVPGNHDVNRDLISFSAEATAGMLADRDSANRALAEPQSRQLIFERFEGYATFANDYFGELLPFDDERYFYVRTVDLAGRRIALLGINSAWLCASDEDREKGLVIGERQVRTALKQAEGADLKVALMHHPFEWLREFDQKDSKPLLTDNCNCILHGHLRLEAATHFTSPDSTVTILACGACYKTPDFPSIYNWVRLDLAAGIGTAYLRRYSDDRGGFWTKDTLSYRNAPDGYYKFALGTSGQPGGRPLKARPSPVLLSSDRFDSTPAKVFISYNRGTEPDERLALHLYRSLKERGHAPFIDQAPAIGTRWAKDIQQRIESSDFLLVLLSAASVNSEMVAAEIKCAHEHKQESGHPHILPIRVTRTDPLPYGLGAYLDALQHATWQEEDDTDLIARQVQNAIEGKGTLLQGPDTLKLRPDRPSAPRPQPSADARSLVDLRVPSGIVGLESRFYIERGGDSVLKREVLKPGTLAYIRAARQTGKSSLLIRGVHHAREQKKPVIYTDCQFVDTIHLRDLDAFLRCMAELIANAAGVDGVDEAWQPSLTATIKMSNFLESKILKPATSAVLLALDETDRLYGTPFKSDFFSMVRAWYNRAQWDEVWGKLSIAMVISTEPYLLIDDVNQSPFNVGTRIELEDFDEAQVGDLNRRHGSPLSLVQVREMTEFFAGHPYLTRIAFYTVLTEQITWPQLVNCATERRSPFGDHLHRYLWLLRDKPELTRAVKRTIKSQACPDELLFHRLQAAGLIRRIGSECVCRCPLYERFFREYL